MKKLSTNISTKISTTKCTVLSVSALVAAAAAVFGVQRATTAADPTAGKPAEEWVYADKGVAIKGYDPVAYFTAGAPTVGSAEHATTWHGAEWRFATADNLAAFEADPEKYAPQYGGYCAWGLAAKGKLFPIDPTAWKVVDEKLYLNFNADVQQTWLSDTTAFIESADEKWEARVKSAK